MAQFVFGGKDNLLNVAHIAGLRVCDGTINERAHWRDDETYGFCLVAEMTNGQMHELARWKVKHIAFSARMKLIESMGNDEKILYVTGDDEMLEDTVLHSSSVRSHAEALLEECRDLLKAVEGHLDS